MSETFTPGLMLVGDVEITVEGDEMHLTQGGFTIRLANSKAGMLATAIQRLREGVTIDEKDVTMFVAVPIANRDMADTVLNAMCKGGLFGGQPMDMTGMEISDGVKPLFFSPIPKDLLETLRQRERGQLQ